MWSPLPSSSVTPAELQRSIGLVLVQPKYESVTPDDRKYLANGHPYRALVSPSPCRAATPLRSKYARARNGPAFGGIRACGWLASQFFLISRSSLVYI